MNLRTIFCAILLVMLTAFSAVSQDKIGYANIELMIAYMPETKSMNQSLQNYQNQVAKQLKAKQDYATQKLQEYQEYAQQNPNLNSGNDPRLKGMEEEIIKLEREIKQFASDSEANYVSKQQAFLEPITKKLKAAIKRVADEQGYTFIINSVDGSGVSIVLHGPEDRDLTIAILTELGIDIPSDSE